MCQFDGCYQPTSILPTFTRLTTPLLAQNSPNPYEVQDELPKLIDFWNSVPIGWGELLLEVDSAFDNLLCRYQSNCPRTISICGPNIRFLAERPTANQVCSSLFSRLSLRRSLLIPRPRIVYAGSWRHRVIFLVIGANNSFTIL